MSIEMLFRCSDGEVFLNEDDAEMHEQFIELEKEVNVILQKADKSNIAKHIVELFKNFIEENDWY